MGVATGGGVMEEGVWMSGVTITWDCKGGTGIIGPVVEEEEEEKAPVNQQQVTSKTWSQNIFPFFVSKNHIDSTVDY